MPERLNRLGEAESAELLNEFVGRVAMDGDVGTYDKFTALLDATQIPLAISSFIHSHGSPNPHYDGQTRIATKDLGWRFFAATEGTEEYDLTAEIIRDRRKHLIGARERSLVIFPGSRIDNAMALEDTASSDNMYLVSKAAPGFQSALEQLGDQQIYSYHGNSANPSSVTTASMMALEARLHGPETLTQFLRITSSLVGRLLIVTNRLKA